MNNYIYLDGKQYKTNGKSWHPEDVVPSTERILLSGSHDVTFAAASILVWAGQIEAPTSATGNWGTIGNLRTSLRKRQLLQFRDHYYDTTAITYNVKASGPFKEDSKSVKWDGASNVIFVNVKLTATA
jgi:hypothetical protein